MLFADHPNEQSAKESLPTAIISSAVGHSQQSAKTSFADCLAGGKEKQVAKVAGLDGALRRPFASRQAVGKDSFFIFEI
jgi:hypothetical protein